MSMEIFGTSLNNIVGAMGLFRLVSISPTEMSLWPEIRWNTTIMDTIGKQKFVRYSKLRGFWNISSRRVICVIGLLTTTWPRFQSFPLLYADRECYAEASITSNSANL